jgi:hypothetical protein
VLYQRALKWLWKRLGRLRCTCHYYQAEGMGLEMVVALSIKRNAVYVVKCSSDKYLCR